MTSAAAFRLKPEATNFTMKLEAQLPPLWLPASAGRLREALIT
jgi:hypothetical protein